MPKKIIKNWLYGAKDRLRIDYPRWLQPFLDHPNLFHLNRNSISRAVGVGIFCAFIPLPIQTLITMFMCLIVGANLPLAVIVIWISNPITIPPMFFLTYKLGSLLLDREVMSFSVSLSWDWFSRLGEEILVPLFVGSFLSGLVLGIVGYRLVLFLWRWKSLRIGRLEGSREKKDLIVSEFLRRQYFARSKRWVYRCDYT